jgi:hypothetical protein
LLTTFPPGNPRKGEKVLVGRHYAEGEDAHLGMAFRLFQESHESVVVAVGFEQRLSSRAAIDDVENVTGLGESGSSKHGESTEERRQGP